MLIMVMSFVQAEIDPCDFDADGDVDASDLSVFSEKYGTVIWYKDYDRDGYSDGNTVYRVLPPRGYYSALELMSTTGDCNDDDRDISPGAEEDCYDGIDNDCDKFIDDSDHDCLPSTETGYCSDGVDNDEDGYTDCDDVDCSTDDHCNCFDGIDNDLDGWIDNNDPDCQLFSEEKGFGNRECNDGLDNDGDGFTDNQDQQCSSALDNSEQF